MVSGFGGDRHNYFRLLSRPGIVSRIGCFSMSPEPNTAAHVRNYAVRAALVLAACFAVSLFFLAYPIYVIRPFRHQGAGELATALSVLRYRPVAMGLCVAMGIFALILYWRSQTERWRRAAMCVGTAGVCLFAALSRINIYEMMFHPMGRPQFQPAGETKLDAGEMVTAVEIGPVARAYPVRITSYHHIVNDVVNGVPIVATY
jgi:hypothetical protein